MFPAKRQTSNPDRAVLTWTGTELDPAAGSYGTGIAPSSARHRHLSLHPLRSTVPVLDRYASPRLSQAGPGPLCAGLTPLAPTLSPSPGNLQVHLAAAASHRGAAADVDLGAAARRPSAATSDVSGTSPMGPAVADGSISSQATALPATRRARIRVPSAASPAALARSPGLGRTREEPEAASFRGDRGARYPWDGQGEVGAPYAKPPTGPTRARPAPSPAPGHTAAAS